MSDVRVMIRSVLRQPALNALAVIALALGIGLTATMFSIVYGVVLRGLPFEQSEQLVHVARSQLSAGIARMRVPIHDFADWRAQQRSFEDLAAFQIRTVAVATSVGPAARLQGSEITPSAFRLLRVRPLLGRTLLEGEQGATAPDVIILGYAVWRDQFNRDPQIIGRVVRANARPSVVIGVMPEGFAFPFREDVWLPMRADPSRIERGLGDTFEVFGRLRAGISIAQATTELRTIAEQLATQYPESNRGIGVRVQPYMHRYIGQAGILGLYTMLGAVFGVLLIACVNVTNLSLARVAMRSRQIAVQVALGATRARVLWNVLAETLVLVTIGGGLGIGLAVFGIEVFNNALPAQNLPFWVAITLDAPVTAFVAALVALSTVLAGMVPAVRASRMDVHEALTDGSHGATGLRLGRASRALVMLEVALSSALLVGASLMIQGVIALQSTDWGFPVHEIFTARVDLPEMYGRVEQAQFAERLLDSLHEHSGVRQAALATALPVLGTPRVRILVEGQTEPLRQEAPTAHSAAVTPAFFDTFGVTVLRGRGIADTDRDGMLPVAVVNESFARQHFEKREPVGHRFRPADASDSAWLMIVGVVEDAQMDDVSHPSHIDAGYYVPLAQIPWRSINLAVRADGRPSALGAAIARMVSVADPDVVVYASQTMRTAVSESTWFYGLFAALFGTFGVSALALGMIGLYGVLMFSVRQRTREIGVRMALGARPAQVLRLVMGQGLFQFGVGLVVGLVLAAGLARMLVAFIYGVHQADFYTFALVSGVLTATALLACLVPARQATRIDPIRALRTE
jgi:putative ABC transport system permease protein